MRRKKIGILSYLTGKDRQELLSLLSKWKDQHANCRIQIPEHLSKAFPALERVPEQKLRNCDVLVAVGGDGTFLSAARLAGGRDLPLLGVNRGKVGFLTDIPFSALRNALDTVESGKYIRRPRMMLDVKILRAGKTVLKETVLNEIHVQPAGRRTMLNLAVELQNQHLTDYFADGLLISTSTGSTAYNLSAGGPILHPATEAVVLNPLNPASLSVRPLVIPSDLLIRAQERDGYSLSLVFDGRVRESMQRGDLLEICRSSQVTWVIRSRAHGFVEALRNKLGWTGAPGPSGGN